MAAKCTACRTPCNPWDMRFPLCVGNMFDCAMFSFICALPSQPQQKLLLPCSAGSQVLRHSLTSPVRTRPHCGLWPSRTGLDPRTKACWRSPGSRACCFLSVRGLYRLRRTGQPLAYNAVAVLPSSYSSWSRHPDLPAFRSSITPPTFTSGLRFKRQLTMPPARLEVRMESLIPFLWGSFIPYNMPVYPGARRNTGKRK